MAVMKALLNSLTCGDVCELIIGDDAEKLACVIAEWMLQNHTSELKMHTDSVIKKTGQKVRTKMFIVTVPITEDEGL